MIFLIIRGQCKSGKNNMGVTRQGRHFPLKAWAMWRDDVLMQIKGQIDPNGVIMCSPYKIDITYYKGDLRRRDVPGMIDALFHCFESVSHAFCGMSFSVIFPGSALRVIFGGHLCAIRTSDMRSRMYCATMSLAGRRHRQNIPRSR